MKKKLMFKVIPKEIHSSSNVRIKFPKASKYFGFYFIVDLAMASLDTNNLNTFYIYRDSNELIEIKNGTERKIISFEELRYEMRKGETVMNE